MECVLVTGASGYVGLHCVAQLLKQGYLVKGTVRSLSREAEIRDALTHSGIDHDRLALIEANLCDDSAWQAAMDNCDYVLHVASPFFIGEPTDPDSAINTAVEGTLRVLRAASAAGVKKTVLTSSCGAITENSSNAQVFTEDDWTDPQLSRVSTYFKSKALAERAAWTFATNETQMALTCINPSMIIGPSLSKDIGTSNEVIKSMIDGTVPVTIALHFGYVDVRDVAEAHILAMKNEISDGQRLIVSDREMWLKEVAALLRKNGYKSAPRFELPNILAQLFALFNDELKSTATILGKKRITPANRAKQILAWSPRDARNSILESARQIRDLA